MYLLWLNISLFFDILNKKEAIKDHKDSTNNDEKAYFDILFRHKYQHLLLKY